MLKQLVLFLIVINLFSCSYFQKKNIDPRTRVAKVDSVFLYKEDIIAMLPKNYKKKDSAVLVNGFINSWATKQLLLSKARLNLKDDAIDINELVKKYREDLLINIYREAVVNQNLDTIVSDADIDLFYESNKETLKLNEELLKLKYIQMDKNIIHKKNIKKLFASNKKEDMEVLIEKELEFKSFYFNDSVWVRYTDVLKKMPFLKKTDLKVSSNSNKYQIKEDSVDLFLIKINKVLKRNSTSPKSYVSPTIKRMILHTRKLKLLKEIEKTLLNDANKNGKYEIYK